MGVTEGADLPPDPAAPQVSAPGTPAGPSDYFAILSGTAQNVVGIVIAALATLVAQILMSNTLGAAGYGVVTVVTQAAFVLSFATRAGMDMAVLRDVAIEAGQGRWERIRVPVARACVVAATVSALVGVVVFVGAAAVRTLFSLPDELAENAVEAAALGLPFLALANVWLSATRGLKIMRYTLYVFWAGQPIVWVILMVLGWRISETEWMSVLAYSLSWVWAAIAAFYFWRREARAWASAPMAPGDMGRLARYAGPRAPAALFSQLLFWTDLFVLTRYAGDTEVGIYSAALRAGQILVLFLTSVSLMFSPYVADLHSRSETAELDRLFKTLTRWTIAATIPLFLLLTVAPSETLRIFGAEFSGGQTALLILLAGQFVNIATGSVGFVLIMVGRTGWDLAVYGGSLALNLGLAFWLCPRYGMEGAAIANAVTFAVSKWARLALVKRFVSIQPYDRDYGRLLAPAAVGLAAMYLVHSVVGGGWALDVIATGVVGTMAYLATYLAIGLTPPERRGIAGLRTRLRTG
ncbi:MAG TPA: oligosaccharide flippase family protein [Actinomycetota bacterium]|nr:oligosaccharide flippase family protein [Actinomycetota bacterium]